MLRRLAVVVVLLFLFLSSSVAFRPFPIRAVRGNTLRAAAEADKGGAAAASPSTTPYLKFECTSCAYVYDEETGYKKRAPPGTRWAEMQFFACPVCGAAKDKFVKKDQ
jgi:rubredoxin